MTSLPVRSEVVMLRRAENVRLKFQPSIFTGKGRVTVWVGKKSYTLSQRPHKDEWARDRAAQQRFPVLVMRTADRHLWQFQGRFYWDTDKLRADQVHALLATRQQREQQRINRAQAMVVMGDVPRSRLRGAIPDDVKQFVWRRDGGHCRQCGSASELQYDHVIPVVMGGNSTQDNLQILCGPCNRRKGAGLTAG
jgi:5-methylcytosine-specific restriction endonuclease McrA